MFIRLSSTLVISFVCCNTSLKSPSFLTAIPHSLELARTSDFDRNIDLLLPQTSHIANHEVCIDCRSGSLSSVLTAGRGGQLGHRSSIFQPIEHKQQLHGCSAIWVRLVDSAYWILQQLWWLRLLRLPVQQFLHKHHRQSSKARSSG